MFSTCNGDAAVCLQFLVAAYVVWNDGLFEPAKVEWLEQRQHALRIIESPAHVGIGHYIDAIAHHLSNRAHQPDIPLHSLGAVDRPPAKAQLHRLVTFVLVALRFHAQFIQRHAVEAASINGDALFCAPPQQPVHGLFGGFPEQVPQCNIDRTDCSHPDAFASEGHRSPVHLLP